MLPAHRLSLNACAAVQTSDSELMRKGTLEQPGLVSSCSSWRTVCCTCAAGQRSTLVTTTNVGMCRATENPKCSHVVPTGIEHTTEKKKKEQLPGILALRKCEEKKKWRCRGSNPGPLACEASALPLSYIPDVPYATEIPVLVPKVTILSMASSFIRGWRNTGCHTQAVDSDRTVQRSTYPLQSLHPPQAWKSQGGGQ